MSAGPLAGLDPGRSKCGLVLTDPDRQEIRQALVLPPEAAWERLEQWRQREALAAVVIGDGTGSGPWRRRLAPLLPVELVDERGTTLAARRRSTRCQTCRRIRLGMKSPAQLPRRRAARASPRRTAAARGRGVSMSQTRSGGTEAANIEIGRDRLRYLTRCGSRLTES